MAAKEKIDPRITKRRVTMQSATLAPDGKVYTITKTDYVTPDFLDAYVASARKTWQVVEVSDEPDAGPGGYHGQTVVPEHINHPAAGELRAATKEA